MKSIVFDNAGTIIKRVTVLNDVVHNKLFYETNTIGIANQKSSRIIIVLQEHVNNLLKIEGAVFTYLSNNMDLFEISYLQHNYAKEDVINALKEDHTSFNEVNKTINHLINNGNAEIISGCALIIDMEDKKIEYVYTAGGLFFKDTRNVIDYMNKIGLSIYIASGDNKESLANIASILNIPASNIYSTLDSKGKCNLVSSLQKKGGFVYMVGNNTNDKLALQQADIGILTLEQGEIIPNSLKKAADYIVNSIDEVMNIIKEDNEV